MKLLLDEMFTPAIAEQLRRRGLDVHAVKERHDLVKQTDEVIFAVAQAEGRALVTENIRHFRNFAWSEGGPVAKHAGVIYTTERAFFRGSKGAIGRIVAALDALSRSGQPVEGMEVWLRPADG